MFDKKIIITGAGFTGLSAALFLAKRGAKVTVIEADKSPGGLAGTFDFSDGVRLEKFYHHWFTHDVHIVDLIQEMGMNSKIILLPSLTGMYYNGRIWNLSTPLELLKFKALPFLDRIRLGLVVLFVRRVKDWKKIEHLSIREWLEPICGKKVFSVVWEPLLNSKFSLYAEEISAVWMWKKLVLRGSTRSFKGKEELAYFKGGFAKLTEALVDSIRAYGGEVKFNSVVTGVKVKDRKIVALETNQGLVYGHEFLFTPALPIISKIFKQSKFNYWLKKLDKIQYLGNVCLVLRLKKSLSETYWLNVNDPGFPFVGVIEHTNLDKSGDYGGTHIVYLSRYLPVEDPIWGLNDEQYLDFAWKHLKRMFPKVDRSWVIEFKVCRTEYAQPITGKNYSKYIPEKITPYQNAYLSTMAQIYPEDRGTNYAVRDGRAAGEYLLSRALN